MASNTDVVKKNMSVLCLYLCVCMSVANLSPYIKTRSSKFPQLFTMPGVNKVQGRSSLLTTLMTVDVWLDAHTRPSTAVL